MPGMHADLDHPHVHLTLDFIVLLLGRALLLLADSSRSEPESNISRIELVLDHSEQPHAFKSNAVNEKSASR